MPTCLLGYTCSRHSSYRQATCISSASCIFGMEALMLEYNGIQVRGGDDPFDIPIYTLCRRWVRNDPYNDETPLGEPRVLTLLTFFLCIIMAVKTFPPLNFCSYAVMMAQTTFSCYLRSVIQHC